MIRELNHYRPIVGDTIIDTIDNDCSPLIGKHIIHINSTYTGGGVAEILDSMVPIFNKMGISTGWRLLHGNPDFFAVTKKFHNALQGDSINLSRMKKKVYEDTNKNNTLFTHIEGHDCIIIHDPQPLPFINYYRKTNTWIWRCHIDISNPNKELWNYLRNFIIKYDKAIVSKKSFLHKLPIPQEVMHPSIDPLNNKNKELSQGTINKFLKKFSLDCDKPIICQVSRFDKWKDPIGVIRSFGLIRKKVNCKLILLGSMATDDPEGQKIYNNVINSIKDEKDIQVINFENDVLVNSVQRISSIIIQKSIKEGFGLTVSEALWKKKPVVASNVGGIPLQVKNKKSGYLIHSVEQCAKACVKLLKNPKLAKKMGEEGHNHVRKNFLITRHISDYIKLLKKHLVDNEV